MKKIIYAAAFGMTLALAACGSKTESTTETTGAAGTAAATEAESTEGEDYLKVTAQEIRDVNKLSEILKKYDSVQVTVECQDGDTNVLGNNRYIFYTNDAGDPQMRYVISDNSAYTAIVGTNDSATAEFYGGADTENTYSMCIMPSSAIEKEVSLFYDVLDESDNAEPNCLEDDALIVTTKAEDTDGNDGYTLYYYYVNPDTLELYALREEMYSKQNESDTEPTCFGKQLYSYEYDADVKSSDIPSGADSILTETDPCKLTAVFNPGKDTEESQYFEIKKGTDVIGYGAYAIYEDEACTKELETVDTTGDAVTIYLAEKTEN